MPPKSTKSAASRSKKKQSTRTGPHSTRRAPSPPPSPPLVHPPSPPTVRPRSNTHIRPPHLSYGNPSISSLLTDDTALARYLGFKDRPFVPIHNLTSAFLDSLQIAKLHDMLGCQPMTSFLLDNNDCIFPGMVSQFFANLRFEHRNRTVLLSSVNRIPIRLTSSTLNTIYGTTLTAPVNTLYYWDDTHLWPQTSDLFNIAELRTMFNVASREAKDFNPTFLAPVDRVVYHILVNFINPVAGHFTNPGKVPLVYYFLFTHHTPIDWGFVVFSRLSDIVTDPRRNLPHAQFLTPVFKHFQVPLNEGGIPPHAFDMGTLNKKGIRLHQGTWLTRQEYLSSTQASTSSQPPLTRPSSSQLTPPLAPSSEYACLLASVQTLQTTVNNLIDHVRYLEHGVKMGLPAELREEYESDSILFDIPWHTDTTDDSGDDSSDSAASDSDASPTSGSASPASDDEPLIHHFKKSKPLS